MDVSGINDMTTATIRNAGACLILIIALCCRKLGDGDGLNRVKTGQLPPYWLCPICSTMKHQWNQFEWHTARACRLGLGASCSVWELFVSVVCVCTFDPEWLLWSAASIVESCHVAPRCND
jgi:hypothetical protein